MHNAINALNYLVVNLPGVPENELDYYNVDPQRVMWTGHSMGGAGCWFLSTHFPDVALGAACVAGFISIEKYVPFYLRNSYLLCKCTLTA